MLQCYTVAAEWLAEKNWKIDVVRHGRTAWVPLAYSFWVHIGKRAEAEMKKAHTTPATKCPSSPKMKFVAVIIAQYSFGVCALLFLLLSLRDYYLPLFLVESFVIYTTFFLVFFTRFVQWYLRGKWMLCAHEHSTKSFVQVSSSSSTLFIPFCCAFCLWLLLLWFTCSPALSPYTRCPKRNKRGKVVEILCLLRVKYDIYIEHTGHTYTPGSCDTTIGIGISTHVQLI